MNLAKLLVIIAAVTSTMTAWAHNGRESAKLEEVDCEKILFDSDRHEAHSAQIATYFSHLPAEYIEVAITIVESEPVDNLNALLEITRGVKDSDGKWIKKPLTETEIENLFSGILQELGVFTPGRLYNSLLVNRDPVLFYEAALDLYRRYSKNKLTPEDIDMIGRVSFN